MPYINPHPRSRTICVFRHQPALCALSDLDRAVPTPCAGYSTHALPVPPQQVFSRSTSSQSASGPYNLPSHYNAIQIP
jgi:hypothetical protein